ncbi:MAG: pilus assembly protein [Actinomycetota bacterium]|nr:pilus assembly protein [Actinomycetota bacterium]
MRRLNDDRGAVGVFMAITIVVLLGAVGLTIDVGALYRERRELRNGADAGALAIAEDCALGVSTCNSGQARALAKDYANANASDRFADVIDVDLDLSAKTVTVHLGTLTDAGGRNFEPFFARVVGFTGTTVHATATARWGYPSELWAHLPLIISECEFPQGTSVPTPEQVFYFHDGNNAEPCNAQAGLDADGDGFLAGGFGWLTTDSGCERYLLSERWYDADPGSSPSTGCEVSYVGALVGDEVALPIFDDILGVGAGGTYHIAGFALFHITGYHFGGQYSVNPPCRGDQRCVSGYFTSGIVYDGKPGGDDHGFAVIELVG